MKVRRHRRSPVEKRRTRYWVVSPNVNHNERIAKDWRRLSLRERAAFMGYGRDHPIGQKFAKVIEAGDVILIARQYEGKPEFVAYGVVVGKAKRRMTRAKPVGARLGSLRRLRPFRTDRPPLRIALGEAVRHTQSLVELHPDRSLAHRRLCDWMARQLRIGGEHTVQGRHADRRQRGRRTAHPISMMDLRARGELEYKVRTRGGVLSAIKKELLLIRDYEHWLRRKGRDLQQGKYGRLTCDACEPRARNLIEAKSSTKREFIRMGVGQLLDYGFQGRAVLRRPNMALLLPRKPDLQSSRWLEPLNIKLIWREGGGFRDNADGQFT